MPDKKTKNPLYKIIFQKYQDKIFSDKLTAGKKLPSESEIMKEFKVSRITVVRALKELESCNLIYRVKGSGSFVSKNNEIGKTNGAGLDTKPSIISLVLPFAGSHYPDILKGIEAVAKKEGCLVTIHNSHDDPEEERRIIEDLIISGSRGIIVYPNAGSQNMDIYSRLLIEKFPFVFIDRKIPGIEAPLVWVNNHKAFYDITNHLFSLSHERLIFIGSSVFNRSSEYERYKGFCKAHIDNGIPLMKKNLFSEKDFYLIPSDYMKDEPAEIRECHFLFDFLQSYKSPKRPTGIVCVNDQTALLIMTAAIAKGIIIPDDYSITGFDNLPFTPHLQVPLTTMSQPAQAIGTESARELFKNISLSKRKLKIISLEAKIIIRQSTAKAIKRSIVF